MRLILYISFIICIPNYASIDKPPITWGKVSEAEQSMPAPENDPDAPAIVLCDYGEISVSNRTFYKRHVRIKILKPEGIQYASIEIPYCTRNKHDDVTELKAHSLTITGDKVQEEKVKQKDIFEVKIDENNYKKILTFPDVKAGSIIEYKYTIASLDFAALDDWCFQQEIPVIWSEIRFSTPDFFTYLVTFQKGYPLDENETKEYVSKLNWMGLVKTSEAEKELQKTNYILYESPDDNFRVFVVKNRSRKVIMKNLPGYRNDGDIYDARNAAPKLKFHLYLSSGKLPFIYNTILLTTTEDYETKSKSELMQSRQSVGYVHYRLESWAEMNQRLLESSNFGLQLIKYFNHKPIFKDIIKEGSSDLEKMQAIYTFCQNKIKWNGTHAVYVPNGLTKPFNKGEATSSEINMLMIYLLRKAEFDADPVLVRTRELGRPETIYPVHNQFNHVIVAVTADDIIYLMDATGEAPFGRLPEKDINYKGFLVRKKEYGWVNLEPTINSNNTKIGILTRIH